MKFPKRLRLLFCFAAFVGSWVTAQQNRRITGIIVDSVDGTPVEFAHIHNFSRDRQIYSNSSGEFRLEVNSGDTLVIYGVGYFYEKVVVNERMLTDNTVKIFLKPQPYNLSSANIIGIGNYEQFKHKLINESPLKTRTEQLNESLAAPVLAAAMEGYQKFKQEHPVIASIPIYTPEELERIKLNRIMQNEKVKDQVYQKFNPVIVKEITGLNEDDEIIEFMVFCNFSDSYIIEVNTYDLAERIAAKFELFKKKKQDERLKNDPVNFLDDFLQPFA